MMTRKENAQFDSYTLNSFVCLLAKLLLYAAVGRTTNFAKVRPSFSLCRAFVPFEATHLRRWGDAMK